MQMASSRPWIGAWGVNYSLGVDGISLFMVLLTTFTTPIAILGSFNYIRKKERAFYALMLLLEMGVVGVFLATDLFLHEKVTTTEAKAKAVRPLAEKMITKARRGDLHARRVVMKTITSKEAVAKLFEEVAPRYEDRPGGYTRITKLGPRRGDGANEAIIELV